MKQNIPKRTRANNERKQQKTPKISQAVSECVREIGYETTQGTRPLKTSLSEHIKKSVFLSDIFLNEKPGLRAVSLQLEVRRGMNANQEVGRVLLNALTRAWGFHARLCWFAFFPADFQVKEKLLAVYKKKPVDRTISQLL